MKLWTKTSVCWPNITDDLENYVRKCQVCEKFKPNNVAEPLICDEIPDRSFEKIGADFCERAVKIY